MVILSFCAFQSALRSGFTAQGTWDLDLCLGESNQNLVKNADSGPLISVPRQASVSDTAVHAVPHAVHAVVRSPRRDAAPRAVLGASVRLKVISPRGAGFVFGQDVASMPLGTKR